MELMHLCQKAPMTPAKKIPLLVALLILLTGCAGIGSHNEVGKLDRAAPVGSPFTRYLAGEYRDMANRLQGRYLGSADAKHFARKGLAAADGMIVMPEVVTDWNISAGSIAEMTQARAELVNLLEGGARETSPGKAAYAQSRFDCWVMEQEGSWSWSAEGGSCKGQILEAISTLKGDVAKTAPPPPPSAPEADFPAPVTDAPRGMTGSLQEAAFLVFFDWDKYNISRSGRSVLDTVAQEIKGRGDVRQVVIVGHTDTSGGERYNQNLSMKRANAARSALVSLGIAKGKIRVEGRGETDLLVKTPDNVREQENRRAEIMLE
jgi:OOP family OmpA-OmpF porin